MKYSKFIGFIESLNDSDPILMESIFTAYYTIFEATTDITTDVLKAYYQLLTNKKLPRSVDRIYNEKYRTEIKLNGDDVIVFIMRDTIPYKKDDIYKGMARGDASSNKITIYSNDLMGALYSADAVNYRKLLSRKDIMHTILHELSHVTENSNRTQESIDAQMEPHMEPDSKYNLNDNYHQNHAIERLPNKISIVASGILQAMNNNITDPHEILKYIKTTNPYLDILKKLAKSNKQKIIQSISTTIYKIFNQSEPKLNDIINMIMNDIKK